MKIFENYDLSGLNTFGVKATSSFFVEVNSEDDLKELFNSEIFKKNEKLFLGGGSNVLFTKNFEGIVILNKLKGINILEENEDFVLIKAMGGEVWHDLVLFSVSNLYWGIENLSLVPGSVGATPVQNIGAYGVEIKDVIESVEAYEIETSDPSTPFNEVQGKMLGAGKRIFKKDECEFGYRESIFKKNKDIILKVVLVLKVDDREKIKDEMKKILKARNEKLPLDFSSAGSVFKNIEVNDEILGKLKNYEIPPKFIEFGKIPAAWFIEQCNLKDRQIGGAKISEKHANFIVNTGKATAKEVAELIELVKTEISQKFGMRLEEEIEMVKI